MKSLTNKEEEIMNHYWDKGEMQIRELQALYDDPKPHVNTLSTLVHILEDKGFLSHRNLKTRTYAYFPKISREGYKRGSLNNVVNKFFGKSYLGVVSTLVSEEKISLDELKELIKKVEENKNEETAADIVARPVYFCKFFCRRKIAETSHRRLLL